MRVIHVIGGLGRGAGGPSRSVQGLVAAECAVGIDAWLVTLCKGDVPWVDGVGQFEELTDGAKGFPALVERLKPELVHIHGIWGVELHRCALMCRKKKIPYVIAPRGMLEPWSLRQKWLKKRIARFLYQDRDLKKAAALHATAASEAAQFRKLGFKNYCIVSPNGVNVPEGEIGLGRRSMSTVDVKPSSDDGAHACAPFGSHSGDVPFEVSFFGACVERGERGERGEKGEPLLNAETQRRRAEEKVEEWLAGVDETTFAAALENLVAEKMAAGEYLFEHTEDVTNAIAAAKVFFEGYSRRIVELSDGRCVYFAPDPRAKMRNADNSLSWAEYAFHAVSSGGDRIPGKNYNYRKYNEYKVNNSDLIEVTLKSERCVPVLKSKSAQDAVKFFGAAHLGGLFDVVVRLDECGNVNANMTEVTFEASTKRRQKKLPQLVSLAEAVRTVVSHQTATGTYPPDKDMIANSFIIRKGGGEECLNVGIGECLSDGDSAVNLNLKPQPSSASSPRSTRLNPHRALFVSRMHPKKGVLELVESWARVFGTRKVKSEGRGQERWVCELVYTLNGDEERTYEQQVKDRIRSLGLSYQDDSNIQTFKHSNNSPDFILTGPLNDDAKWEAYARADLFVLPTYSENFGIVVAEALYAGVPVITTKGTPWADLEGREVKVEGQGKVKVKGQGQEWNGSLSSAGRCGWWIELPSEEVKDKGQEKVKVKGQGQEKVKAKGQGQEWSALDSALREACGAAGVRALPEMGANGKRLVEQKYLWSAVVKAMVHGYEQVLEGRSRGKVTGEGQGQGGKVKNGW